MEQLFAGVSVAVFDEAVEWYERFFSRAADVLVHDYEVMWRVAPTAWLYVIEDASRAGKGVVTISVPDLDAAVAELEARGVTCGAIEAIGDAGHKATLTDPDGNRVALIQVTADPG
jgi:predicted enzyme related to lactoylglutathione lyase